MPSKPEKYDIFISYRRDGGADAAKHLRDILTEKGYKVFYDNDSLASGDFNTALYGRIEECTDFLIILSPGSLDRCVNKNDWVRQELAYALKHNKNVIPVKSSNFHFPENLPEDISGIRYKNAVSKNMEFFDAMVEKLISFLQSKPKKKNKWIIPVAVIAVTAVVVAVVFMWSKQSGENSSAGNKLASPADEKPSAVSSDSNDAITPGIDSFGEEDDSNDASSGNAVERDVVREANASLANLANSRQGLIEKLKENGFSAEEAAYGADNCGADWNEQAARVAQDYVELRSDFSTRSILIRQLIYIGFTQEEAEFGADAVMNRQEEETAAPNSETHQWGDYVPSGTAVIETVNGEKYTAIANSLVLKSDEVEDTWADVLYKGLDNPSSDENSDDSDLISFMEMESVTRNGDKLDIVDIDGETRSLDLLEGGEILFIGEEDNGEAMSVYEKDIQSITFDRNSTPDTEIEYCTVKMDSGTYRSPVAFLWFLVNNNEGGGMPSMELCQNLSTYAGIPLPVKRMRKITVTKNGNDSDMYVVTDDDPNPDQSEMTVSLITGEDANITTGHYFWINTMAEYGAIRKPSVSELREIDFE